MIIPLFGLGNSSRSVSVSDQRRINVYAEVSASPDKTPVAFYGMPGLTLFTSFGDTPPRGGLPVGDLLYVVHRGTFYEVNNAGVRTARGTIGTTVGRVQMAQNGQQVGMADGQGLYMYTMDRTARTIQSITNLTTTATLKTTTPHGRHTGETITVTGAAPAVYNVTGATITVVDATTLTYTMASNPGGSASVVGTYSVVSSLVRVSNANLQGVPFDITWLKQVFAYGFVGSGIFQISAIDDGTTNDALDFATAESEPDNLVRVVADHGEIVLFGTSTTEFWGASGNSDFPFSNQTGSESEFGLAAPWSLVKYNDSLCGLMRNKLGQVQVMMLNGHTFVPLPGADLNFFDEINTYAAVDDATAFAYNLGGHPIYQINFPTAGKSWFYDASSGAWGELQSGMDGGRHRGEMAVNYLNKTRVFDYQNGNIYTLDPTVYTDNGVPRPYEISSRHIFKDLEAIRTGFLQLDFEAGQGLISGQGSDPKAMLQVSRDNGHTWGNELWRPMGKIGEYRNRVIWRRLGRGYDFVFKVRVTDPIKFVLAAAAVTNG